jgi:hypothetical protein
VKGEVKMLTKSRIAVAAWFAVVAVAVFVLLPPPDFAQAAEPRPVSASETKDWGSVADAAVAAEDVAVGPDVALGDYCLASMSLDVQDLGVSCSVTAANVATVVLENNTGSAVDLASGTLRVQVFRRQPGVF